MKLGLILLLFSLQQKLNNSTWNSKDENFSYEINISIENSIPEITMTIEDNMDTLVFVAKSKDLSIDRDQFRFSFYEIKQGNNYIIKNYNTTEKFIYDLPYHCWGTYNIDSINLRYACYISFSSCYSLAFTQK